VSRPPRRCRAAKPRDIDRLVIDELERVVVALDDADAPLTSG
jgi:hypothetical protein